MSRKKPRLVQSIRISGIADKGKAVGRDPEGEVYFIQGAVPGDLIDAVVLKKRKGVKSGVVHIIREASPDRTTAFCEHFQICGGCKWQNLLYKRQLLEKEKIVIDAFKRLAKIEPQELLPIIAADPIVEYRNKLEYTFSSRRWVTKEELDSQEEVSFGPAVGFHRAGSFDKVVEVSKCHLQENDGNLIRDFIRDFALLNNWSYYNIREHSGVVRNLILRNNRKGDWMVNLILASEPKALDELMNGLAEKFPQIKSLHYTINTKKNDSIFDLNVTHHSKDKYITEDIGKVTFKIGSKSFFQTNPYQSQNLYQCAKDFADLSGNENIYDLYTGLGSIALYMADSCKHVVGIEEIPEAILDAHENKKMNDINNASFYAGDVKDILTKEFSEKHGSPDVIITDPPRAGMHEKVIDTLLLLRADKIVYVSCNPATQARDISLLSKSYDLIKVRPVDMFPHTSHIENVALLKLRNEES